MLARLPILVGLAGLAAADFKIYWFSENVFDPTVGTAAYGGIKLFTSPPDCNDFVNGANQLDVDFDGDVSDSQRGGYACDGCDDADWNVWRPGRVQINDFQHNIFTGEPYYITLYGDGDGTYTVRDTVDNVVGDCSFVENRQVLSCGTEFGPYEGIEFVNCVTPNLGVQ